MNTTIRRSTSSLRIRLLCLMAALPVVVLHAQTVKINPSYTTVGVNGTVQYQATVTGLANTSVTWSVVGVGGGNATYGTITTAGLYKAPAAIPANGITVTALCSDKKTSATVYVAVEPPGPSITTITPNPIPVGSYSITVKGTSFKPGAIVRTPGVNLTTTYVNSTTLTTGGYHATAETVNFQVQNPGTLWGAPFPVPFVASGPPQAQTISPTTATVKLGATQQFTSAGATSWTATAGIVSNTGLYTAPANMPASPSVTVTATGPGGTASATVTLQALSLQTIAPTAVSLNLGATQQFTSAGATTWTATSGAVNSSGFYTAPATMPASGTDTVTATGPQGSASATVTLNPPTPVITGVGSNGQLPLGLFSTTVTGTGFVATSVAMLNGAALGTTLSNGILTVTGFANTSGPGNITVKNGTVVSQPFPVQVGSANTQVSAAAARRFLEQ